MHPRTVALVGALSLAAGWTLGGRFAGPAAGDAGRAPSGGPRPLGVESVRPAAPLADQLRLKLDRHPVAPRPSRNPFVFGRSGSPDAGAAAPARGPSDVAAAEAPPPGEPPGVPPPPAFTLSGIAATRVAEGVAFEYTAILSGSAGLVFARPGEVLPGGIEVLDVQEQTVTLRDSAGAERTLRLR